jgi:hypothetical protein
MQGRASSLRANMKKQGPKKQEHHQGYCILKHSFLYGFPMPKF